MRKHTDKIRQVQRQATRRYWVRRMTHSTFQQAFREVIDSLNDSFAPRAARKMAEEGMAFCLYARGKRIRMITE